MGEGRMPEKEWDYTDGQCVSTADYMVNPNKYINMDASYKSETECKQVCAQAADCVAFSYEGHASMDCIFYQKGTDYYVGDKTRNPGWKCVANTTKDKNQSELLSLLEELEMFLV